MPRCGGCDNNFFCLHCSMEYMELEEALRAAIQYHKEEMESLQRELHNEMNTQSAIKAGR